ncbi:uncharacterized protein si:ch211-80h18.1 isoform X4 [Micropterus salmoides]|uniref:uncharacterized protein si:ch211-80h18.1 isoform X4 n=1 Tax=Micropterus salmoides TaxID=27706 RepID=UPI0018EBBE3C|nr:uncharacterized protein si:ch211-80h18.1 isoform X4 [Micropterus salmoides]
MDPFSNKMLCRTYPVHHLDISIDQSGPDHTSLGSGPDQSLTSSVSGSSHSAAQGGAAASSSSLHAEADGVQTDGADSADANGNGRQTLLLDTNGVTDRLISFSELQTQNLQTDLPAGGAESATGLHIDLTVSGLGLGHDVTESSPVVLHTESVDSFTHTLHPASGGYSYTDLVTMTTDSTGLVYGLSRNSWAGPAGETPLRIQDLEAYLEVIQTETG